MSRLLALAGLGFALTPAGALRAPELGRKAYIEGKNPEPCGGVDFLSKCDPHVERIKLARVEKPQARRGYAVVRIRAGSINAHDWEEMMVDTRMKTLGLDLAGTVEAAGAGCSWQPGDEVWGTGFDETDADYALIRCGMLGKKPANLSFVEAASLPIVATTGLGALWKAGAPWKPTAEKPGPTVLVLGGAGGSGSAGIQLAKAFGAGKVITTCSPSNFDFVKGLGADEVIDYHTSKWWEVLGNRSVDVIYDCVMERGTGDHAYEVLKDNGSLVALLPTALAPPTVAKQRPSVKQSFYLNLMEKATKHLDMMRKLVDEGKLRPAVDRVFNLDQIQEAFKYATGRHASGKVMLRVDP